MNTDINPQIPPTPEGTPSGWGGLLLRVIDRLLSREIIISVIALVGLLWIVHVGIDLIAQHDERRTEATFKLADSADKLASVVETMDNASTVKHQQQIDVLREWLELNKQRIDSINRLSDLLEAQNKILGDVADELRRKCEEPE